MRVFALCTTATAVWALATPACTASTRADSHPDAKSTEAGPPRPAKRPHELVAHGDVRVDDYYWLSDPEDPEVLAHLRAENAWADQVLGPLEPLSAELVAETKARMKLDDVEVPVARDGWEYYSRTTESAQYPIYCRRKPGDAGSEEVLLDLNLLAKEHEFFELGDYEISHDATRLAYSVDTVGYRQYRLRVLDLPSREHLALTAERVTSVAWSADDATLLYSTEDDTTKRSQAVHVVDVEGGEPTLVYQENDERFTVHVGETLSREWIVLSIGSHTTSEARVIPTAEPRRSPVLIRPREQDIEYDVSHRGGHFLIRVNDAGRNYRIVRTPVASPGAEHWEQVQAHDPDVMISEVTAFAEFIVVSERADGLPRLRVLDVDGRLGADATHTLEVGEPAYDVWLGRHAEFDTRTLRVGFESFVTPETTWAYDVATRERTVLKRDVVRGFDAERYVVERFRVAARDGTEVPVSLVRSRELDMNQPGGHALHLVGYGAYGSPYDASFSHSRVSLLDRGVIFAIAHVRGGGDLGKTWHDAGRMEHKRNTFTDFVDVADALVERGYTSPASLSAEGGSAGGLLMGAVVNMRPELFRAVIADVPFVDVLTTMSDESIPLTVGEYEEWGNPGIEAQYWAMKEYCPYTNAGPADLPALLVYTSLYDSQVMYSEPAKWVAKLRGSKTDDDPLVLRINMNGGHGGSSGRFDRLHERARFDAFLLWQYGLAPGLTPG